jgi:hypothetical protein
MSQQRDAMFSRADGPRAIVRSLAYLSVISFLIAGFPAASSVKAQEARLLNLRDVRDLSLPLGEAAEQPTAFFRCAAVTPEQRRVGILRLGLLPRWVFRGVEVDFTSHASSRAIADLADFYAAEPFLRGGKIDGFILRHDLSSLTISAKEAEYGASETAAFLMLREVQIEGPDQPATRVATARLYLTGPRAGFLDENGNPNLTIRVSNQD